MVRIIFRDLNPVVVAAVASAFDDVTEFDVACADVFSAGPADAIVNPGNSYGWMDGGIDLVYLRRFGWRLQDDLMSRIAKFPGGLLPIGAALVVPTRDLAIPAMISAPTMIVPGPVPDTPNAYLAFRAALVAAREFHFNSVICPGLATLIGRMDPVVSAAQMREAWDESVIRELRSIEP
jgi:O-acetyl-ADP-ribose deacetylase (regulator of RNase III)